MFNCFIYLFFRKFESEPRFQSSSDIKRDEKHLPLSSHSPDTSTKVVSIILFLYWKRKKNFTVTFSEFRSAQNYCMDNIWWTKCIFNKQTSLDFLVVVFFTDKNIWNNFFNIPFLALKYKYKYLSFYLRNACYVITISNCNYNKTMPPYKIYQFSAVGIGWCMLPK